MTGHKKKLECPCCAWAGVIGIIYGNVSTLSDSFRNALWDGDVVFGGERRKWDWEEELIDTQCLRCQHEWHA